MMPDNIFHWIVGDDMSPWWLLLSVSGLAYIVYVVRKEPQW